MNKLVNVELLSGASCQFVLNKISVFIQKKGGYNDLPNDLYVIYVDGIEFIVKSKGEFERIKQLVRESK